MNTPFYSPDNICKSMGMDAFTPLADWHGLRVLLTPSFAPELCITLTPGQIEVVALETMLWLIINEFKSWRRLPEISEKSPLDDNGFNSILKTWDDVWKAYKKGTEQYVFLDGMGAVVACGVNGQIQTLDSHASMPWLKGLIRSVIQLAYDSVKDENVKNALSTCGGYVDLKLEIFETTPSAPLTKIMVLGEEVDRAQLLKELETHKTQTKRIP